MKGTKQKASPSPYAKPTAISWQLLLPTHILFMASPVKERNTTRFNISNTLSHSQVQQLYCDVCPSWTGHVPWTFAHGSNANMDKLISISILNIWQFLKQKRTTIPFSLTTSVSSLGCICGISDCQSLRKNKQAEKSHVWLGLHFQYILNLLTCRHNIKVNLSFARVWYQSSKSQE